MKKPKFTITIDVFEDASGISIENYGNPMPQVPEIIGMLEMQKIAIANNYSNVDAQKSTAPIITQT